MTVLGSRGRGPTLTCEGTARECGFHDRHSSVPAFKRLDTLTASVCTGFLLVWRQSPTDHMSKHA